MLHVGALVELALKTLTNAHDIRRSTKCTVTASICGWGRASRVFLAGDQFEDVQDEAKHAVLSCGTEQLSWVDAVPSENFADLPCELIDDLVYVEFLP